MAVLMQAITPGLTSEAYDALVAELAVLERLRGFDGFLGLHAAGPTDDGWQVFEVWESADKHQAWVDQVIAPNMPPGAAESMTVIYHQLHAVTV